MPDLQNNGERLKELNEMLVGWSGTLLSTHNLNSRLARMFGPQAIQNPQFGITMPYVERYATAVHRTVPAVEHRTYIRPALNAEANANIAVPSPFSTDNRRMPLVGISFLPDVVEPGNFDEAFLFFDVKPLPEADTIFSVVAQRKEWVRNGALLVELSTL